MRAANDKLFSWLLANGPTARFNLSSSGLPEPELAALGVDTSFERFAAEKDEHAKRLSEEIASLYMVEPQNIVLTNGGSEAIFLVYSVIGPGKRAIVPMPNYGPMSAVPRALGMRVSDSLQTGARAKRTLFGLTDPNNPTGQSLSPDFTESVKDSSRSEGSAVFINETYREFTFPASPRTHFGGSEHTVVCSTMTKFFGLGRLRVGWVIADKGTAQKIGYAKWAVSAHDSEYSLWIAAQVLKRHQIFVERARRIYNTNSRLVRRFVAETEGVSTELGPAPFCLVRYHTGPGSVTLARTVLQKTGVMVAPGDFFGAPRSFRLCFTAEEGVLRAGLEELSAFLNRLAA